MARESQFWQTLSKARFTLREALHMHRVENPAAPGTPDVEGFCAMKGAKKWQFWFELKAESRPARTDTLIHFRMRPKQVEWAKRRWDLGGCVWWLLQVGEHSQRIIYMVKGNLGHYLENGIVEDELAKIADNIWHGRFDPEECILESLR